MRSLHGPGCGCEFCIPPSKFGVRAPRFQRRHYQAVADVIKLIDTSLLVRRQVALVFADVFASDNARFNRDRFIEACDIGDGNAEDREG